MQNRIMKAVRTGVDTVFTFYVRDAQGNVLGVYNRTTAATPTITWAEQHIYGSGRLGSFNPNIAWTAASTYNGPHYATTRRLLQGQKRYELSNHLGNVLVTINDRHVPRDGAVTDNVAEFYDALVLSANDYYPFGMEMPGRTFALSSGYRYGFNSHEKVDEIAGSGNHTTAKYGELDTRLGRRWNLDPKPDPLVSSYSVFANSPIWATDIELDTPTVKEAALMSKLVYGETLSAAHQAEIDKSGWKLSSVEMPSDVQLVNNETGLKSAIFERTINGATEYALAYAGTEDIAKDGIQDLAQILGASEQYDQALRNAKLISQTLGTAELTFTGHSLGGGLANASALYTKKASLTFNPAWVSTATMIKHGLLFRSQKSINNYVIYGEILNQLQEDTKGSHLLRNVGRRHFLYSIESYIPVYGPVTNHMIDNVLEEIEDVKKYNRIKDGN